MAAAISAFEVKLRLWEAQLIKKSRHTLSALSIVIRRTLILQNVHPLSLRSVGSLHLGSKDCVPAVVIFAHLPLLLIAPLMMCQVNCIWK